jgi:hypothetical protein
MMHLLMSYLEYISTRPLLIVATVVAVVCLIVVGRLTARKQHRA